MQNTAYFKIKKQRFIKQNSVFPLLKLIISGITEIIDCIYSYLPYILSQLKYMIKYNEMEEV